MICPACLNSSNVAAATAMLRLFGVVQAEDKLQPGGHTAEILGTVVDVGNSQNGVVSVRNKESRTLEICESLQQILEQGFLQTSELPNVLGRIQFADMQLAGRHGKLALWPGAATESRLWKTSRAYCHGTACASLCGWSAQ